MIYSEVEATVKEVLAKQLSMEAGKINLESRLVDDLGVDSFGSVEVAFELEEKFDLKIPDAALYEAKTVKNIVDYIAKDPNCPFIDKLSEDAAGVGVVKNSKDPRYVMATTGDQNDVTADTMPRQLRAYGLTGRKTPKLGRERR